MQPDILQPFTHQLYTKVVPLALLAMLIGVAVAIAMNCFESWLVKQLKAWKGARRAKQFEGMSEDEILDTPHCPVCNRMMKLRTAKKTAINFGDAAPFRNAGVFGNFRLLDCRNEFSQQAHCILSFL